MFCFQFDTNLAPIQWTAYKWNRKRITNSLIWTRPNKRKRNIFELQCEFEWIWITKSYQRLNKINFLYEKVTYSLVLQKISKKMSAKLYKYPSTVTWYHYYRNYWQPVVGEELDFMYERDNPFDLLAIKIIKKTTGETVEHLPRENLRVTNYLMDRGARFTLVLTSLRYCVSPLVQGGLEIPCEVGIYFLPLKIKNLSESVIT